VSTDRFYEQAASDARRHAPAALRNLAPIAAVLADWLPERGTMLEVASGTGEHVVAFARRFANLTWQPSDAHDDALASIAAWSTAAALDNLRPPVRLDAASGDWPIERADAIVAINMVHISPWAASLGLIEGASRLLGRGAPLILYGPGIERDVDTAPSNLDFDADLRRRNPEWGLRDVAAFEAEAARRGLDLVERRAMPANNVMLLLRRL
jgi:hypothetical protein